MAEHFWFDPVKGISEDWDYDEMTGTATFHKTTDVEPLLKAMHEARATGSTNATWKREMPSAYAFIDPVTEMKLLQKGIDIYNLRTPEQQKAFFKEIETNYPHLKSTDKKAWRA
jgi:hypothetical protein